MKIRPNQFYWQVCMCVCIVLMAGCSTTVKKTDAVLDSGGLQPGEVEQALPGTVDDARVTLVPAPAREKYSTSPVVQGFLNKSQIKFDVKDFDAAANYIERGINISPNDPLLWQRLALIRFEQGDFQQAKQLAKKSNILVETDKALRVRNENIIKEVERILAP